MQKPKRQGRKAKTFNSRYLYNVVEDKYYPVRSEYILLAEKPGFME
jgi:hypothetical protein